MRRALSLQECIINKIGQAVLLAIYYPVLGLWLIVSTPWWIPYKRKVALLKKDHLEIWDLGKHLVLHPVANIEEIEVSDSMVIIKHADGQVKKFTSHNLKGIVSQANEFSIKVVKSEGET